MPLRVDVIVDGETSTISYNIDVKQGRTLAPPLFPVLSTLWSRLFFFSEAGIRQPSFLTDWSFTGFGRAGVGQQGELP